MTTGIEKFQLEEKCRLLYFKHRGNISAIVEETGYPFEYVQKVANKIKKRCRRDVNYLISTTLMEHFLLGSQQRIQYIMEWLRDLKDEDKVVKSLCCKMPVRMMIKRRWAKSFICLKCKKECEVEIVTQSEIYKLKFRALEFLQQEDVVLIDAAEKMGFTNKKPSEVIRVTQNVVALGRGSEGDKQIVKELENLSPMDRQRIRRNIEKKMLGDENLNEES